MIQMIYLYHHKHQEHLQNGLLMNINNHSYYVDIRLNIMLLKMQIKHKHVKKEV